MPTPTGRPRKGEHVYTADGKLVGKVLEVSRHKTDYSVRVIKPNEKFSRTILRFSNWRDRHNWKVA